MAMLSVLRPLSRAAALRNPGVFAVPRRGKDCGSGAIDRGFTTSQVKLPNRSRIWIVAKPELGTKRLCAHCSAKFYDLSKDPIVCPKCGTVYVIAPVVTRGRPDAAAQAAARPAAAAPAAPVPVEEVAAAEPQDAEFVSLEEADAEAQGTKKPVETTEPDLEEEEVEIDETLDDAAFIEEQEEEDADVTDIIGGDIENEEEG
jgi:uncharacterized protein (TIGR02300 family)